MSRIGVPQARKRLVMLGVRNDETEAIDEMLSHHECAARSVRWAIEDLEELDSDALVDEPCESAPATRQRIRYLFDHGLYELPNEQRPACHANGGHSYVSIYGRMRWDEPAQTITTGFYSMCMGRYVHPSRERTITAHEAARLQFLPDSFRLDAVQKRGDLARLVGNAVPMKLGYVLGLELLR
jgi:DNA (cytosine-5)-methyltransferase 1